MKTELTAIIKRDGDGGLGWAGSKKSPCADAQEQTKEELLISLNEAATDILELRREDA